MARSLFVGIACLCFATARGQNSDWEHVRPAPPSASTTPDEEAPFVGITNLRAACADATEEGCMKKLKKLEAVDADPYVTVMDFEIGSLDCKSLDLAEDAKKLQFQLSTTEAVEAVLKHYTVSPARAFSDNIERKIWTGVIAGKGKEHKGIPRTISMTWGGCDPDLFMLKVITPAFDGTTKSTVTIPCMEGSDENEVCLLQLLRQPEEEGEEQEETFYGNNRMLRATAAREEEEASKARSDATATAAAKNDEAHRRLALEVSAGMDAAYDRDPDLRAKGEDVRLLTEYLAASDNEKEAFHERGIRRLGAEDVQMPSGRVLTASTTIDILVVYTKASLAASSVDANQMETNIITSYELANQALADSGVDATLNVVHMAQIDTTEGGDMAADLSNLFQGAGDNKLANELREEYGADLVQMHGNYDSSCGLGYVMTKPDARFEIFGYSIVHVNCINNFSHIHEIGHNMGANHNKENSNSPHEYAFAHRYCDGDSPYRTIMAYESGCSAAPRINIFSNPDMEYAGKSQGTATANNARVIQESVSTVANFRSAVATTTDQASQTGQVSQTTFDATSPSPATPVAGTTPVPANENANTQEGQQQEGSQEASAAAGASALKGYEGCFRDTWFGLELANMPMDDYTDTSHETCKQHCDAAEYAYYALEFGFGCSCGNHLPEASTKAPDDECSVPCTSSSTAENCGGNWHLAVFSVADANTKDELAAP